MYEFGTPIAGTYPVWYDPSYWYEGLTPHFDLTAQMSTVYKNIKAYWDIFSPDQALGEA